MLYGDIFHISNLSQFLLCFISSHWDCHVSLWDNYNIPVKFYYLNIVGYILKPSSSLICIFKQLIYSIDKHLVQQRN